MTLVLEFDKNDSLDISADIKDNIDFSQRTDYSFGTGKCTIVTANERLSHNIPPYTLCRLNGIPLVCESTCHKYLTQQNSMTQYYIHDVTFYELSALLETLVLGVKAYTDNDDWSSLLTSALLIRQKYESRLDRERSYEFWQEPNSGLDTYLQTFRHDYTFGAGTTFYAVLSEIARRCNIRIFAKDFAWSTTYNHRVVIYFNYYMLDYSNEPNWFIDTTDILSVEETQQSGNYCKSLETIQNNVVDRSNKTRWNDMTCRNLECAMDQDNCIILLPTNVESIEHIYVNSNYSYNVDFSTLKDIFTYQVFLQHGQSGVGGNYTIEATYQDFISWNISYNGVSNIFQYLYDNYISPFFTYFPTNYQIRLTYITSTNKVVQDNVLNATKNNYYYDYSQVLLEETEWNALDAQDKAWHMVYKKNSNTIYNLNGKWQQDFWGTILGYSQGNFLEEVTITDRLNLDTDNYLTLYGHSVQTQPMNVSYSIEAYPVVNNLLLIENKTETPLNESYYRASTRSYQNSESTVDFDYLINDFKAQTKVLGTPELSMEITLSSIQQYAHKKFVYNSVTWYVNSLIYRITPVNIVCTINASSKPNKIADAIGVDYQFNPVKLPIENVVTRPIFYDIQSTTDWNRLNLSYINHRDVLVAMSFEILGGEIPITLRGTVFQDADGSYYVYASMLDNYSAGKKAIYKSVNKYEIRDVPYVDSDYLVDSLEYLTIVCMYQGLPAVTERKLPNVDYDEDIDGVLDCGPIEVIYNQELYKDSRETLAFVIKVSKSN